MPSYFTTCLGVIVDLLGICKLASVAVFEVEKYSSFILAILKKIALLSLALTSLSTSLYSILAFFLKLFKVTITDILFINERYFPVLEVNTCI